MNRLITTRWVGKPMRVIVALAAVLGLAAGPLAASAYADEPANADAVKVGVASMHELVGVGSVRTYRIIANVPGSYSNWLTDSEKQDAAQEKTSGDSTQQRDAAEEQVRQGSGAVFTITDDVTGGLSIDADSVEVTAKDPDAPADEKPTILTPPATTQDKPQTDSADEDGNGDAASGDAKQSPSVVNPDYTIQFTGERNAGFVLNLTRPEEQAGRDITVKFKASVYGITKHLGNGANVTYTDPTLQDPKRGTVITTRSAITRHYEAQLVIRNTDEDGGTITGARYTLIDHATGKRIALACGTDPHVLHVTAAGSGSTERDCDGAITMPKDGEPITIDGLAADGKGAHEYELREKQPAEGHDPIGASIRFTITPKYTNDTFSGVDYKLDDNGLDISTINTLQRNRGDGTDLALGLDVQGAVIDGESSQLSRTLTITSTTTGRDANSEAQRKAAVIAIGVLLIVTGAALITIRRLLQPKA
ncbi:hypothetical protein EMO89_00415 [Bifidobacterium tissieri]|uniref:Cell surface protein n=1 Tax=Bifidobacterium tissieri TaxID=1630162 RepID=A0A5M9ZWN9_9BIFI|nr:hypothetical protein [Bifidobacterium tissieri]KAA8832026.1 hypothetical protein EMO89_00415 [Bifidobacterium tissieri]